MPPFTHIPDFDETSARRGVCYILNIPKPPEDSGVFRGPAIDHEGFLDISERAIREAAQSIGMLAPAQAAALRQQAEDAAAAAAAAETERANYKARLEQMIQENAELLAELQAYREAYPPPTAAPAPAPAPARARRK